MTEKDTGFESSLVPNVRNVRVYSMFNVRKNWARKIVVIKAQKISQSINGIFAHNLMAPNLRHKLKTSMFLKMSPHTAAVLHYVPE